MEGEILYMAKESVEIKMTDEFKETVLSLIDKTIEKVLDAKGVQLSNNEIKKLKNLALDQINVHVTSKINNKNLWNFNTENSLSVLLERESKTHKMGSIVSGKKETGYYTMKPNSTWCFSEKDTTGKGYTKDEFEKKVLQMFLEDVETASFYGAISYVESD